MAKVTLNQLLEMPQGGIGGQVFRQMPDGTIIISGALTVGGAFCNFTRVPA